MGCFFLSPYSRGPLQGAHLAAIIPRATAWQALISLQGVGTPPTGVGTPPTHFFNILPVDEGRFLHKNHFKQITAKSQKPIASNKIITFAKRIVMDEENKKEILERLNNWGTETLAKTLGIVFTDVSEDSLSATMPVNPKVHQPYGILHGGASVALAETLGSCLSFLSIDPEKFYPVGTNINSNHLRPKKEGTVTGRATFIRKGRTMHISQIEIRDEQGKLINHTTMTNTILSH